MKKIAMKTVFFLVLGLYACIYRVSAQGTDIELKDGFFYIDGEKFFIKGIGYEVGAYPGMLPWARPFNADVLRSDMQRIKDAGFNTIRTWAHFTNEELQVIQEFDLKIIMGIWSDPAGDFSDPAYVNSSLQLVRDVLAYSKNYDNIIAYLIMNEPAPDHIFDIGYSYVYTLWKQEIQIIHNMHPGRAVSIANTCVGDFIDPQIFDFSAYNVYPYNPATVNFSHKYPAYVSSIYKERTDGHPLVITEYGLSVSPSGPGNWGYGGNTPEEQEEGIRYMYRSLIDGNAGGSCVFIYSDGWWKSGDEFVHDDNAEEWFGLVEYASVDDHYGTPRLAWDSLTRYNRAIINHPKNEGIYTSQVPVEIFAQDTVARVEVWDNGTKVMDEFINNGYFNDTLILSANPVTDYDLKFNFYNATGQLMKTELITILASDDPVVLPAIEITATPEPEQGNGTFQAGFEIVNNGPLETDYVLDYVFYHHIGWDYGTAATANLSAGSPSHTAGFSYTSEVDVITLAAGINATYGNFTKRITAEKVYLLGDTAHTDPPAVYTQESISAGALRIYPNPATDYIYVDAGMQSLTSYRITDACGRFFCEGDLPADQEIDIGQLPAGFYVIMVTGKNRIPFCSGFLKMDYR